MAKNADRIEPYFRPQPVKKSSFNIVVAGEFNSGKSSVINLLLRQNLLPATVGFSGMPPIRMVSSDRENYMLTDADGNLIDVVAFQEGKVKGDTVKVAEIGLPLKQFEGAVITEVSMNEQGEFHPQAKETLLSADLLVWCTMGQRAWCLTEILAVKGLPENIRKNAIMVATRADLLANRENRQKVQTRLKSEAGDVFNAICMVDASTGSVSASVDGNAWETSGGSSLCEEIMSVFKGSEFYQSLPGPAELLNLSAYRVDNGVEQVASSALTTLRPLIQESCLNISREGEIQTHLERCLFNTLDHISNTIADCNSQSVLYLSDFTTAAREISEMDQEDVDQKHLLFSELILQLEEELTYFARRE